MSQVYEELAQKSRRLQKLFVEIEKHFDDPDVASVDSYQLTDSLGVQIKTSSDAPLIVGSVLQQARYYTQDKTLSAQLKTVKESTPIDFSVGNSPTAALKPGQPHKKSLPELLKADLWNRIFLEREKLSEVLAFAADYKQVEKDGIRFYFDEELDWLVEDDADAVTVYGKSEKYGLLKEVRDKLGKSIPLKTLEALRTCLAAEINLLEESLSSSSLTKQRRELMLLELATDTIAADFLE